MPDHPSLSFLSRWQVYLDRRETWFRISMDKGNEVETRAHLYGGRQTPTLQNPSGAKFTNSSTMAMLTSILGFSGFGLLVRFWQLGIQKRNIFHCEQSCRSLSSCAYMDGIPFVQIYLLMLLTWSALAFWGTGRKYGRLGQMSLLHRKGIIFVV